jgi:hypothetical protein
MESPVAANGGRGEYMTIPEDVEAAKILPSAAKAEAAVECPSVLRWRAIRWWAQVTVLGIFLAAAAAAAVVFLGPLVIKKVRLFRSSFTCPHPLIRFLSPASRIVLKFVVKKISTPYLLCILLNFGSVSRRSRRGSRFVQESLDIC